MARHRGSSIQVGVIQIIALLFLGMAFSPVFRGMAVWLALIVVAGISVFVVYRLANRGRRVSLSTDAGSRTLHTTTTHNQTSPENRLHNLDWFQFEKLAAEVYRQQGYAVERRGGANPDGGVDLVVSKDGVRSAVQCKHWKSWKVGVKQIREFLGALTDQGFQSGIFVTLQQYTGEARGFASRHHIQLIGEQEFLRMLGETGLKSDPASILNDSRKVCPKCESDMVRRTARRGKTAGQEFWGCSTFPRCSFTVQTKAG